MTRGCAKMRFRDLDVAWLKDAYYEKENSLHDIARELNVAVSTVWNWMNKLNFSKRSHSAATKVVWKKGKRSRVVSEETKRKISETEHGKIIPEELRRRWSISRKGRTGYWRGRAGTAEAIRHFGGKNNANWRGGPPIHICETCGKSFKSKQRGIRFCSHRCCRIKQSADKQGIPVAEWKFFTSFLPYCSKFNQEKREEIRNQYNRVCVISGISALQNGFRLCVDHVDENKEQGCNGIPFKLIPLDRKVHAKMQKLQNHLLLELLLIGNKRAEMNYEF